MPLYSYKCEACGNEFEGVRKIDERYNIKCPQCRSGEIDIILTNSRPPIQFPEGEWDIGKKTIHISSRRQLKEEMQKHNESVPEHEQSYAKYLDGYGGY